MTVGSGSAPPDLTRLLEQVRSALPGCQPIYLVGGAVRDSLLGRKTHDLDFALGGDSLGIARQVANALGGAYFTLDAERDTGRVVLNTPSGERLLLDFAGFRGPNLEADLRGRDFTINAMALTVESHPTLLDPLGGAADLRAKRVRACSAQAFEEDPLRILRGARQAVDFNFSIEAETRQLMRLAAPLLPRISVERLRDELFRIFDGKQPAAALRLLDYFDVLPHVLPELIFLKGVAQSPPHHKDVWNHTLDAVQRLSSVLGVLALAPAPDLAANLALGLVSFRLGRYRPQLAGYLSPHLNPDRSTRALLFLAALYHDCAKLQTASQDEGGRIRFFDHEQIGAEISAGRARWLHLSNVEIDHLQTIVRQHMRPLLLTQTGKPPSRRAIYRFFHQTGEAGIGTCILSLADILATYGPALPTDTWERHVLTVRALLEAWWENPAESVAPPALLNGNDIMQHFNLPPGPRVGQLLEAIREAQAAGEVSDRQQALDLARRRLE